MNAVFSPDLRSHEAIRLADLATESLRLELETWPKPGLVSHVDTGSHSDMDAGTLRRSASTLRPFFVEFAQAGARGDAMPLLRKIGLRAERAMLKTTDGINTHRGAIFGLGLLCAAAGLRAGSGNLQATLGTLVSRKWGREILVRPRLSGSHGEGARIRYGAGGARWEAAQGFPNLYRIGIPALRQGHILAPANPEAARVQACFALIAAMEDTNLLHRGGPAGLRYAQRAAQAFLDWGGVGRVSWSHRAAAIHSAFIRRNLSPGGAADLLAMSIFALQLEKESAQ